MKNIIERLKALIYAWPKTASIVAGAVSALAMAPTYIWPVLMLSLTVMVMIMNRTARAIQGAWCTFLFGMGYFTFSLFWVANALLLDVEAYWWATGFAVLGLPLLLSILWFVAGFITVRVTRPQTLSRAVLFLALLCAAEYGRAFNLTGFPWNLFGYTWGNVAPLMQISALGGAYLVTLLTVFWMATPVLARLARPQPRLRRAIIAASIATFIGGFAYGVVRLGNGPTILREDVAVVIVQPNIQPDEKWEADKTFEHFMRHVRIAKAGLDTLQDAPPTLKNVAIVWPETSLEERLMMANPEAPRALLDIMQGHAFTTSLVSGLWREEEPDEHGRPAYYNSVGVVSVLPDGRLNLDDVYDKHHLVPFGEFLPMEQTLGLTPLVGFAGFKWGAGPKVLRSEAAPPVAPMICFEAIFPWYAEAPGAQWLVNPSNDGWYGNTPGPYQHLAMTRFRAIEQGIPIARSATTGISALIDPYGRVLQSLDYQRAGFLVNRLPATIRDSTLYARFGETAFFILVVAGILGAFALRRREI